MNWYKRAKLSRYIPIIGITNDISGESISSQEVDSHQELFIKYPRAKQIDEDGTLVHWRFYINEGKLEYFGDPTHHFKSYVLAHLRNKYGITQINSLKDLIAPTDKKRELEEV